ncbi:MAG: peptidoglycan bridge formation glycyltransferase FemA/FemB family protein [Bacteroidales bacterium]|nr:peptidoglycan bridge formation glycyltransferase FemA/FemB family protein [Bacteroidales bacterium]
MHVLVNCEISRSAWNELLLNSNFSTPFQTAEFYAFINSIPGYTAIALAIEDSGKLSSLVVATLQKEKGIKGYFTRRSIIYGGPLVLEDDQSSLHILLKELNLRLKGNAIYLETRNFHNYRNYKNTFAEYGWKYTPYLNFRLNCSSYEVAWNQLNTNRKRQISKALKNGVTIKEAASMADVKKFYAILKSLYDTRIKKPLPSIAFFEAFYKAKIGKYLLVHFNDNIVGGIICPMLTGKAIYEFYIAGLDQEYKEASPSVMATWAAIDYGYKNGFQYFDFMGAGKPAESYGVREFKGKFGGELVEYGRFTKINNKLLYKLGASALSLMKQLKK